MVTWLFFHVAVSHECPQSRNCACLDFLSFIYGFMRLEIGVHRFIDLSPKFLIRGRAFVTCVLQSRTREAGDGGGGGGDGINSIQ